MLEAALGGMCSKDNLPFLLQILHSPNLLFFPIVINLYLKLHTTTLYVALRLFHHTHSFISPIPQ